ncbi:MAG: NAD(P)H-hydrate dehydratase [Thermodesulfobacteriota bacterium]|nr:NAD(P)H-hydrate dehydratase [Thermodesulfobacteriota bacterium]
MLTVVGTVPDISFPLTHGPVSLCEDQLSIGGRTVPVHRGTPALLAAAARAAEVLAGPKVYAFLAGDIGRGHGSREIYQFLERHLADFDISVLTFHYLQPDVDWHNRVLFAADALACRPLLIADAGFMYAAKMSGQAESYDIFTPDAGELAFLADEAAPHPFYTRGFILHTDNKTPDLIARAYDHANAATHLVVKGQTDYIVKNGTVLHTVDRPSVAAMEAVGGTGDTLTGLVSVLCCAGFFPEKAGITGAKANRWAGVYAHATPATQVADLVAAIPRALEKVLR